MEVIAKKSIPSGIGVEHAVWLYHDRFSTQFPFVVTIWEGETCRILEQRRWATEGCALHHFNKLEKWS